MLKILKVTGNSLSPFFLPGDYVLISTFRPGYKYLQSDTVVVFHHSEFGRLIKRVHTNYPETKNLKVVGSHENSISSHKLGLIPYSDLIGKVIFQIKKPRTFE
jgi:phage repressor protein C with HTH and peptisase S24 domain